MTREDVIRWTDEAAPAARRANDHELIILERVAHSAYRAGLEAAAHIAEALRDDHCAGTRLSSDPLDHCRPEGDDGCEFVAAWNDCADAIRAAAAEPGGKG
jgi:hypothetical protein